MNPTANICLKQVIRTVGSVMCLLLAEAHIWQAPAATVTLKPLADATVSASSPAKNFGALQTLSEGRDEFEFESAGLLAFPADQVPANATINKARLRLYLTFADGVTPVEVQLAEIASSWNEMTVTWNTRPEMACCFGGVSVPSTPLATHIEWDATELVRKWQARGAKEVKYSAAITGPKQYHSRVFQSREGNVPPELIIDYSPAVVEPASFSISGFVRDPQQDPVPGVTLHLSGGTTAQAVSGVNGEFAFSKLPEGGNFMVRPESADREFYPGRGAFDDLKQNQTVEFLAWTKEPVQPRPIENLVKPAAIQVELSEVIYRTGQQIAVRARFGPAVRPTEPTIKVLLVAPTAGDMEVIDLSRSADGSVYTSGTLLPVADPSPENTKFDLSFAPLAGEMFAAMLYVDAIPSIRDQVEEQIVSDVALKFNPNLNASAVTLLPELAMTDDEKQVPPGGKPVGALAKQGTLPLQIAVGEVVLFPSDDAQLQDFLERTQGKIQRTDLLPGEQNQRPSMYLIVVDPPAADPKEVAQMRSLLGDNSTLYGSNPQVLNTYAFALKYVIEGFNVGVNPRLQFAGLPLPGEPAANITRTMTQQDVLSVPKVHAFMALWDFDQARIPTAFLDQGFAPNPDFRRPLSGAMIQCDLEGRNLADLLRGFSCGPDAAVGPPTVGNSFFGGASWHGNGVVSVAGAVINNGFGTVGVGGQVVEPMLYRMGLSSYAFEMGLGIRKAVLDGATVINLSAGYPCRVIDELGIEFNICAPAGRAALCATATATLALAAGAVCATVPVLAAIPFVGPILAAAASVACAAATTAVVVASTACFATLAAGDPRGPLQAGVDFATANGVPVVTIAGNTLRPDSLPPILRDIIDLDERRTERWSIIPAMMPATIVAGASQDNWPFANEHFFGDRVDVWAPIRSGYFAPTNTGSVRPAREHQMDTLGGTSAAAPYLAGLIANLQAINPLLNPRNPALTPAQRAAIPATIKRILTTTAWTADELNALAPAAAITPDEPDPERIRVATRAAAAERRNLVNPIRAIEAASVGVLPDFTALGYDNSLDFFEWDPVVAADTPGRARLLGHETERSGTIISIRGEGGAPALTDIDHWRFFMPAAPAGMYQARIFLTIPRGRGQLMLGGRDFSGPFAVGMTALEEVVSFTTPLLFNNSEVVFPVTGIAGSDNVYKLRVEPPVRVADLPEADRFDINQAAVTPPESRPNNNIDLRGVHLGTNEFVWVRTDSSAAGETYEISIPDLNFHSFEDTDWFMIADLPRFSNPAGVPGCEPELEIVFGSELVLTAQFGTGATAEVLLRNHPSPVRIPSSWIAPGLRFRLEPRMRGAFIEYDLQLNFRVANQRLCELAEVLEGSRAAREIFGSRRGMPFPAFLPELREIPAQFKDMPPRLFDPRDRVITPDRYILDWQDKGNFNAAIQLELGESLRVQLTDLQGNIRAEAMTSDLFAEQFGDFDPLNKPLSAMAINTPAGSVQLLQLFAPDLPPGTYLLDISHGTLGTEFSLWLPEGAVSDGSSSLEDLLAPALAADPELKLAITEGKLLLNWDTPAGAYQLEASSTLGANANWKPVAEAPAAASGSVTVLPNQREQFYRLRLIQ